MSMRDVFGGASRVVIYDTEMTAWPGSFERGWSEPWEHRELIQLAAVRLNLEEGVSEDAAISFFGKPTINLELSDYITELTGVTQEQIDSLGKPFEEVLAEFFAFCDEGQIPAWSWGPDEGVLQENAELNKIVFPRFSAGFFDIRKIFNRFGIDTSKYSSGTVYKSVGLSLETSAHDALNDVRSIIATVAYLNEN